MQRQILTFCIGMLMVGGMQTAHGQTTTLTVNNAGVSGDIADFVTGGSSPTTEAAVDFNGDFLTTQTTSFLFSNFAGTTDTGISRDSAGVVSIDSSSVHGNGGLVRSANACRIISSIRMH